MSKQFKRRQRLFKALAETIRDIYDLTDYKDMTAREVWKRMPKEDKNYWSSQSVSRRLRKMPDIDIIGKKNGAYVYRLQ